MNTGTFLLVAKGQFLVIIEAVELLEKDKEVLWFTSQNDLLFEHLKVLLPVLSRSCRLKFKSNLFVHRPTFKHSKTEKIYLDLFTGILSQYDDCWLFVVGRQTTVKLRTQGGYTLFIPSPRT